MIRVTETMLADETVFLDVSGVLDQGAVPILRTVCQRHLDHGKRVTVNLEAVVHITRDARDFIQAMRPSVSFSNVPEFMRPHSEA